MSNFRSVRRSASGLLPSVPTANPDSNTMFVSTPLIPNSNALPKVPSSSHSLPPYPTANSQSSQPGGPKQVSASPHAFPKSAGLSSQVAFTSDGITTGISPTSIIPSAPTLSQQRVTGLVTDTSIIASSGSLVASQLVRETVSEVTSVSGRLIRLPPVVGAGTLIINPRRCHYSHCPRRLLQVSSPFLPGDPKTVIHLMFTLHH